MCNTDLRLVCNTITKWSTHLTLMQAGLLTPYHPAGKTTFDVYEREPMDRPTNNKLSPAVAKLVVTACKPINIMEHEGPVEASNNRTSRAITIYIVFFFHLMVQGDVFMSLYFVHVRLEPNYIVLFLLLLKCRIHWATFNHHLKSKLIRPMCLICCLWSLSVQQSTIWALKKRKEKKAKCCSCH